MDNLYAPWRTQYIQSDKKINCECIFCEIKNNISSYENESILFSNENIFIVMNKYPYSNGHFMIIPNFHTSNLEDLDIEIWQEMSSYAQKGVALLKDVLKAQGVNIGMNLGDAAGAGIKEHIHLHLVPRWSGDTNFISTIANTRVYPSDFEKIFLQLKEKANKYFK